MLLIGQMEQGLDLSKRARVSSAREQSERVAGRWFGERQRCMHHIDTLKLLPSLLLPLDADSAAIVAAGRC